MSSPPPALGAPALLRSVGLLVDGPGQWGRQIAAAGPGLFAVELAAPVAIAPIELTRVGKWLERVPDLRLDGARPTSKMLAARLGAFWLPSQTVLYVGSSERSIARRVASLAATELGDRRPNPAGNWLLTLRGVDGLRIWWAPTDATEEYEDAVLEAFAAGVPAEERAALPDREVVLPFANLRRPDGRRKATGLTGSLLPDPVVAPAPPTRVVQVPDGDADGARGEPPDPKRRSSPARRPTRPTAAGRSTGRRPTPGGAVPLEAPDASQHALTAEGAGRLRAELDQLVRERRPEVVARIRTAKEHGDLSENAEYHAAREEQSFLEGRIQALEARLRTAVIVEAPGAADRVGLGARVTVEIDGEAVTYTIVGGAESDPGSGRISSASPVGKALLGRSVGDVVIVRTPAGDHEYRIVEIA